MATKKTSTRKKTSRQNRASDRGNSDNVSAQNKGYGETVNKFLNQSRRKISTWYENPTSRYIAAGLGLAVVVPIGVLLYRRYPKFGIFVRRNLDNLEDTLKEFRPEQGETISEPHH